MRSLGWDAGELKAGRLADFITVSVPSPGSGRILDLSTLIFSSSACDVNNVVVGGKTVVHK